MTPKEKAEELVTKFIQVEYLKDYEGMNTVLAKQCALIAVDDILNWVIVGTYDYESLNEYWQEVKQEIESI